jgi:hypothetical protein
MAWYRSTKSSGQTVIEVLVAIGLSAIMLPALATALVASREGRAQEAERLQATALARQADEIMRSIREKGWTNISSLTAGSPYRPAIDSSPANSWELLAGAETIGSFTRQIVASDVQRNASGQIVPSGGTVDQSTRKITITVSWTQPANGSVVLEDYYHRYLGNAAWSQTTQAEFTAGTETNTVATATGGGQVELSPGTPVADWGSPSIAGSYNAAGTQDALDVYTVGDYAYLCDGSVLTILNISTPTAPTLVGTYTASSTVRHVYVDGNYAYLSTASDTAELTIVNITNPASPTLASTVNLVDTNDGFSTFVVGGFAYVGRAVDTTSGTNEFYIINVTNPASPSVQGSVNLTGSVNNIKVSGNYAFLATTIDAQEMVVVNVTNKSSPSVATSYNAPGTADSNDLGINGTTLYLASNTNASGAEVYSLNIATPTAPSLLDTYEVGGNVLGISPLGNYVFFTSSVAASRFTVLDTASPSNLLLESQLNLGVNSNDVKATGDYAYVATGSNTQEMMVIGPTFTPAGYQTSGTFESTSFDAGASVAYNYMTFTITEPASTNVTFQVATNNDNATWNYVGPDGTAGTSYAAPATIRLNTAGRYMRYRATLTGPGTSTPVLSDISINYSP